MSESQVRAIELGNEVRRVMGTNLGIAMLTRAMERKMAALDKLGYVNPRNVEKIQELQAEVKLAERFEGWLKEIEFEANAALAEREQSTFTDPIP